MRSFEERLVAARGRERWVEVYRNAPEVFAVFEAAEDPDGLAAARLVELAGLEGGRVLELGAGTGWLTRRIAACARRHVALEPSAAMLTTGIQGGGFVAPALAVRGRAERLPFVADSFSHAVASFMLLDLRQSVRSSVLADTARVLASEPGAAPNIWAIENHGTGEYQALRDLVDDDDGLGEARPLVTQHGFELAAVVQTECLFASDEQAAFVLGAILGDEVRAELERSPRCCIGLDLAILRNTVSYTLPHLRKKEVPHSPKPSV